MRVAGVDAAGWGLGLLGCCGWLVAQEGSWLETVTVITPESGGRGYWRQCWEYRELIWFLARRDLVVRYRQTLAGVLWLFARPGAQVAIFTILLGHIAQLPSGGVPYPVLVMSGAVIWHLFTCVVSEGTTALTNNHSLITKVAFPRLLLPLGSLVANSADLLINLVALAIVMAWFGSPTHIWLLLAPLPILLATCFALGLGLWFCAGCVRFRDFRQLAPYTQQVLFLLSPVGFASTVVPERLPGWEALFYANPLAVAIDLFRLCVLAGAQTGSPSVRHCAGRLWHRPDAAGVGRHLLPQSGTRLRGCDLDDHHRRRSVGQDLPTCACRRRRFVTAGPGVDGSDPALATDRTKAGHRRQR